jgi:hypothetical protein
MKDDALIDYAAGLMYIEKLAKEIHHCCLERQFPAAEEKAFEIAAEARLLIQTLRHMQDK